MTHRRCCFCSASVDVMMMHVYGPWRVAVLAVLHGESLACEMCRLTVVWVDCRCFLCFVFLGGAKRYTAEEHKRQEIRTRVAVLAVQCRCRCGVVAIATCDCYLR